jgi:hypothetical protein
LMKILGDPTGSQSIDSEHFAQAFHVRGRHNILYDVDLPQSLPQDVLERMIVRFKEHLYDQLRDLRRPSPEGGVGEALDHSRGNSFQTDSGITVSTMSSIDPAEVVEGALRAARIDTS